MKNPFTGRDSLLARTSTIDGSIHLTRGLRDAHDAMKQGQQMQQQMQKQMQDLSKFTKRAGK
jgi:hypothetical protein